MAPSTNMLPLPCNGEIENGFCKGNQEQCDRLFKPLKYRETTKKYHRDAPLSSALVSEF